MSYSRWGSSVWYTYWDGAIESSVMDEQELAIWFGHPMDTFKSVNATYKDLTTDLQKVLKHIRYESGCTVDEIDELIDYIYLFTVAVEKSYETLTTKVYVPLTASAERNTEVKIKQDIKDIKEGKLDEDKEWEADNLFSEWEDDDDDFGFDGEGG